MQRPVAVELPQEHRAVAVNGALNQSLMSAQEERRGVNHEL